jgi:hypothetical protein
LAEIKLLPCEGTADVISVTLDLGFYDKAKIKAVRKLRRASTSTLSSSSFATLAFGS